MAGGTVLGLGLAFILLAFGLNGFAGGSMANDPHAVTVLLDHHLPVAAAVARRRLHGRLRGLRQAPGHLLPQVRAGARRCGWRRSGWSSSAGRGVEELAAGYVIAGALGIVLYVLMLGSSLKADGLLPHLNLRRLEYPAKEIFGVLPAAGRGRPALRGDEHDERVHARGVRLARPTSPTTAWCSRPPSSTCWS